MKHIFFVVLAAVFVLSSCSNLSNDSSSSSTTVSASWSYTSSSPVYEVGSNVASLTISGDDLSGKELYLAKTNSSSTAIQAANARYISDGSGITLSTAESTTTAPSGGPTHPTHDFLPSVNLSPSHFTKAAVSRSALSSASASVTQLDVSSSGVDSTTKDIYVDQDEDISTFAKEEATLRASGTYCNVWVVEDTDSGDDYYTTGSASGEQIDSTIASDLASKFDDIYPMVRNIFGDESENLYEYNSGNITEAALSTYDDTGTYTVDGTTGDKVNIVVYDIGADYSDSNSTGIVGYFYAKDYYVNAGSTLSDNSGYKVIDYSNAGKYFYIDAYYAVSYTDMVFSTLAHEFQHMIDWGVKDMDQNIDPSTWYNEMLSMLSEDVMRSYLDLDYDDAPECRLPFFERCYKEQGIEDYISSSSYYVLLMYANSYAFGAWILRQFGGVPVLAAMSSNNSVDMASVVAAVNSVNSTSYTTEDLLKMYAEACIFSDTTLGMPTYNQSQELDSTDTYYYSDTDASISYGYPLEGLDIWDLDSEDLLGSTYASTYSNTSYYKYDGPKLYGYNAAYTIRPYGMTLVDVGEATSDTVTLTLTTSESSSEHLYLMIQ